MQPIIDSLSIHPSDTGNSMLLDAVSLTSKTWQLMQVPIELLPEQRTFS